VTKKIKLVLAKIPPFLIEMIIRTKKKIKNVLNHFMDKLFVIKTFDKCVTRQLLYPCKQNIKLKIQIQGINLQKYLMSNSQTTY